MSYMNAADVVVSMAGYNTVCEILSASKPAVIVPRSKPCQEQLIRAERMANMGLFKAIVSEKDKSNPKTLKTVLLSQLEEEQKLHCDLDMNGLPCVKNYLLELMSQAVYERNLNKICHKSTLVSALISCRSTVEKNLQLRSN